MGSIFPAPADLIIPRLWLGNRNASLDTEFLRKNNITVVVNASKNLPFEPSIPYKYRVPVDDNLEDAEIDNMGRWGPEAVYHILRHYHAGETILVHCAAGMQRSAAIVAMVLIALRGLSTDEAMRVVKERRRVAYFPAANFKRAIHAFEEYYHTVLVPMRSAAASPQ